MKIVILGAPGAGKGTQAELIAKKYDIAHLSTGEILRNNIKARTELGKKAQTYINQGKLVPDDIIINLMKEKMRSKECKKGFILDGFPRTIAQATALNEVADIDIVLNIDVNPSILIKRLSGRRSCANCGAIYHLIHNPPKKQTICDKCKGNLYQRDDDKIETVKQRLITYNEQTKPLIDFYSSKKKLITIDANRAIEATFKEIVEKINSHIESQ
jgi:adenylate kinase